MGNASALGMDQSNAHLDNHGVYHYHGVPLGLLAGNGSGSHVGYAADGFDIHYVPAKRSGYVLKAGARPYGSSRHYDGVCEGDWEYRGGAGTLYRCNGGELNGRFVYCTTDTYPFWPRCNWGQPSEDFMLRGGGPGAGAGGHERPRQPRKGHRKAPPRKP
jgi:hypothetical protein